MTRTACLARLLGQTALAALPALAPFAAPHAALAQAAIDLEPIVVEGTANDTGTGPVAGKANPATQAGAKTATPVSEIPQSVSVIGAEAIRAGNLSKIDEALGYTAGVVGAPYGYDSDTNWHFIRGFSSTSTGVFQDGLQHYAYGFGGFYIDPYAIERIEVLKGAASVLYGGANPGGLVNYVSKVPTGSTGGSAEIGLDDEGRVWAGIDSNAVSEGGLAYRLTGKIERTDGNGAFDEGFRGILAPSLSFTTEAGTEVTLLASYTKIDEDHVGGAWLPYTGTVVSGDFGRIDRDFNTGEPALDWYEREQFMATGIFRHDLGNGWTLSNTTRAGWSDVDESAPYGNGLNDATHSVYRLNFAHQTETRTVLSDTRLEKTSTAGGLEHRLMAGLDLKWFEMDQVQAFNFASDLSLTGPVYGTPQAPLLPPYNDSTVTQQQAGLYVQDQIRWGKGWIATLNGRYDVVTTESEGLPEFDRTDRETSWRLGLARQFENGVTPYASYATYFNPQIGTLSSGAPQEAETGEQYEIGVKWAPANRNLLVTLAAFDLTRENVVQTDALFVTEQLGTVRSRGVELEAVGEVAPGLTLTAAYTDMDVTVEKGNDPTTEGKTPYSTIERFASLGLAYELPQVPGLTVSGGVRHLGSSWADNANTLKVPSVTLYDAGVSYDFAEGWNANLAVSNLTDETYVASCQGASSCFYGDGRKASLALRKSW